MKYLGYLALAILTFAIGVVISPIRFHRESIACGRGSTAGYRSNHFAKTTVGSIPYDSEQEASDAFDERLAKATRVIDLSPKKNKNGVLINQRAVALFHDDEKSGYYVEAFWRDATVLYFIRSSSYSHVMEFERQNF